jgi:hypothetical protein
LFSTILTVVLWLLSINHGKNPLTNGVFPLFSKICRYSFESLTLYPNVMEQY